MSRCMQWSGEAPIATFAMQIGTIIFLLSAALSTSIGLYELSQLPASECARGGLFHILYGAYGMWRWIEEKILGTIQPNHLVWG